MGLLLLAGCLDPGVPQPQVVPVSDAQIDAAVARFATVVDRIGPVAQDECQRRAPHLTCTYMIALDIRPDQPPNAFQTEDNQGRPTIIFTGSLLLDVRNQDELALIMGHEAAHHILGHLRKQQDHAAVGALLFGRLGETVGARSFAKDYEIAADRLGSLIARRAGFDPLRGAAYFTRLPDPGNRFLGTHPPNAQRIAAIRAASGG